jgi:hypothetical protein
LIETFHHCLLGGVVSINVAVHHLCAKASNDWPQLLEQRSECGSVAAGDSADKFAKFIAMDLHYARSL